jgi:hypothetical protein
VTTATGAISGTSGAANGFADGVTLSYDATTGGYMVRDAGGASATFLPASKNPAESNAAVSVYGQVSGNREDQLVLFNPGAGNPTLALTYTSYGAWQRITDNVTAANVATQYFVYGIRQPANQPSTGSASYTTIVDGLWANGSGVYLLGGTSTFTANFTAMTVATSLDLVGTHVTTSATQTLGQFNGTGTIAALGGAFNGSFAHQGTADDGGVYSGSFAGAFFGPQGQEMGYSFSLTSPNGGVAAGAVVGKGN